MNAKPKLVNSLSLLESEDESCDKQIVFARQENIRKSEYNENNEIDDRSSIPISMGRKYERPRTPEMKERYVPSIHSNTNKHSKSTGKEEILLATMDTRLDKTPDDMDQIPDLRKKWVESAMDILTGAPPRLPPFREVNHKIPLKDENKRYCYHLPRCPDSLKPELTNKIQRYKNAGWWEETNVSQVAPMMCVPKKSGKLRTVIDCCKRNDNTREGRHALP